MEQKIKILERFVSSKDQLQFLNGVFVFDKKLCASDRKTLVYTDKFKGNFKKCTKDIKHLFLDAKMNREFSLTPEEIEVIEKSKKGYCKECTNSGEVTWTCGLHEMEDGCPICWGNNGGCIQILQTKLLAANVVTVIDLGKELNCKVYVLYSGEDRILFEIGEYKMLIMAFLNDNVKYLWK